MLQRNYEVDLPRCVRNVTTS